MLRKHIIQAAIISLVIMVVAVAADYLVSTYLIPDDRPYDATTTIVISLMVAPPFVFFLIVINRRTGHFFGNDIRLLKFSLVLLTFP